MTEGKVIPLRGGGSGDVANARRFLSAVGHKVRFIRESGKWIVWDKGRWNESADVHYLVTQEPSTAHLTRVRQIADAVTAASWAPGARISYYDLDNNPWLLNCPNGCLDLRTGKLGAHAPIELFTKMAGAPFDAQAKCPRWEKFLAEIIPNLEVRDWLQRWAGYCATGDVGERMFAVLYGGGQNGKGVFTEALQYALADYAVTTSPGLLMAHRYEQHSTGITDLFRRRLAVAQEVKVGSTFDEELVKRITGDDELTARRMRQDNWSFRPTHKLMLTANERPAVRDMTESFWDRIALVPFLVRISAQQKDIALRDKLRKETPGILAWIIRGCLEWQRRGLERPAAVKAATDEYRLAEDYFGQFLVAMTDWTPGMTVHNQAHEVSSTKLSFIYETWAAANGARKMSMKAIGAALKTRGFECRHGMRGNIWVGLQLKKQ